MGRGPRILPPDEPAVTPYRQTNRRQGDIFEKKLYPHIFLINRRKNNIKIKKIRGSEPGQLAELAGVQGHTQPIKCMQGHVGS